MNSYADDVFKWGSQDRPFGNVKHDTTFGVDDLTTDGAGNVLDQPLLVSKGCFGRPEYFLRRNVYRARHYLDQTGIVRQSYIPCHKCPVSAPCQSLVEERLESRPEVDAAIRDFDQAYDRLARIGDLGYPIWTPRCWDAWRPVLVAIKHHGNWSSVNDARARADAAQKAEDRREQKRLAQKKHRAAVKARRRGKAPPGIVSLEFQQEVQAEKNKRLVALLDLRQQKQAQRWITKLTEDGCRRTVDVWGAQQILRRANSKLTAKALAEFLTMNGQDGGLGLASLATRVDTDTKRIKKLEGDGSRQSIWLPFTPKH